MKKYNLHKISSETVDPIKAQAERKNQALDLIIDQSLNIFTDKNIYCTVLRNMVTNAVKFSKLNSKILVKATAKNGNILVSVQDNGKGIAHKKLKDLFKLKTSKNSNGTAAEKGTGLGLVICREFVEIYGGKIWATSEIGKGSTFYFTVPKSSI